MSPTGFRRLSLVNMTTFSIYNIFGLTAKIQLSPVDAQSLVAKLRHAIVKCTAATTALYAANYVIEHSCIIIYYN